MLLEIVIWLVAATLALSTGQAWAMSTREHFVRCFLVWLVSTTLIVGGFTERLACWPTSYNSGHAGVAELADARDLKSRGPKGRVGSIPTPGIAIRDDSRCEAGSYPRSRVSVTPSQIGSSTFGN